MIATSEATNELAAALSQAQGAFPEIERTRTVKVRMKSGGEYEFDYAPLDSIIGQIKNILAENGLSYRHSPSVEYGDGFATVTQTCRLQHMSGQWSDATIALRTNECSPQAIGSTLTYGRRYTLEHVLGIAAQTDDDGAGAAGNEASHAPKQAREPLPACPKCGKTESVIRGKEDFGGGYVCWTKKEGCNHKWGGKNEKPAEKNGNEQASDPKVHADIIGMIARANNLDLIGKLTAYIDKKRLAGLLTEHDAALLAKQVEGKENLIRTQEPAGASA